MTSSATSVFVHPNGICESKNVGHGTRIWAFAHVLPNARIGRDCNICDGVFIENDVTVGDRVTVKSGVQLWDGVTLEDDVFVGPNATFTNDLYPRSKEHQAQPLKTLIKRGASIGANATILPGIVIGVRAMIGAGTVVMRDVPARAIVVGNPGRIVGYADTVSHDARLVKPAENAAPGWITDSSLQIAGCRLWRFPTFGDMRGDITVAQFDSHLPFDIKRMFFVHNVPSGDVRGEHAHRTCAQLLLALSGSVSVVVDDGVRREEIRLDNPSVGLFISPKLWSTQYHFTPGTVLAVFCSENYDSQEYIRDHDEFLDFIGRK
jgi:acetyltransferase-like isoleucine patch superfamily enzyme/dTDP-4-dehydrorhamnose 3,5-epimerase-like enzyme